VIAVEIHQADSTDSDLSFDLKLLGSGFTTLIPTKAEWRYLDDGSDQGTAWRDIDFDDAAWASGPAEFGYGEGDEATVVNCGKCAHCPCETNFITTYFRHPFTVRDASRFTALEVRVRHDDGAVVHLNGEEVLRTNMPLGDIDSDTSASSSVTVSPRSKFQKQVVNPALLVPGTNVIAVEVHQASASSSDLSFGFALIGDSAPFEPSVVRGPYLQQGTPTQMTIRWRTNGFTLGRVRYGSALHDLSEERDGPFATNHEIVLRDLTPNTKYFYSVGIPSDVLVGSDPDHFFVTSPTVGTATSTRIWVIGDSGTPGYVAEQVRDDYLAFTGSTRTDVGMMLGDNAYNYGTDNEYQAAVFDMFPMLLRNTPLWPALGNHDALSAVSESERGVYFDIFSLPRDGRAGGVASNSEAYYSFDYANVHFLVLDSEARRVRPGEPMLVWADADLAATTQPWIIAYWHQAPYTKGTHDSDGKIDSGGRPTEIREFVLPLLERRGVDLVLTGHSHVYERSSLIDGHYGFSQSFDSETHVRDASDGCVCSGSCPACAKGGTGPYRKGNRSPNGHGGTVYAVVGSSSKGPDHGPIADPHPAMVISLRRHGSMVIDVTGPRLDARWIQRGGTIRDHFTILKKDGSDSDSPSP
jgi:hypothetical protein